MAGKYYLNKSIKLIQNNNALKILLVISFVGVLFVPNFATTYNLSAILFQYSIVGLLALGQLIVILTGGIDLSQGSLLALTSITSALIITSYGLWIGIIGGIIFVILMGFINGFLVSRTSMPPFLVTLGMLGIARGLALQFANAKPVPIWNIGFNRFGYMSFLNIPISTIIWIISCLIIYYFLSRRRLGRYIYAVGSNEESTRLSGINVSRVKLLAYLISAFFVAIGGIIWTARLGSGSPVGGYNYELESIAAVVVGGGNLMGGEGTISGTVAGVLIFGVINSILNLTGVSPFWQGMIKGLIVLAAVALSQFKGKEKVIGRMGG